MEAESYTYFSSRLGEELYKKIKIEAINENTTVKERVAAILKDYVESKYPEVLELEDEIGIETKTKTDAKK